MAPLPPSLARLLDELANVLQVAVLLAEHTERTSAATAQDVSAVTRNLKRATAALVAFRNGGVP